MLETIIILLLLILLKMFVSVSTFFIIVGSILAFFAIVTEIGRGLVIILFCGLLYVTVSLGPIAVVTYLVLTRR